MEKLKSITRGQFILICFIILLFLGTIIGFKVFNSNRMKDYPRFEKELINDAKSYFNANELTLEEGEEKKISISKLNRDSWLSDKEIIKRKCTGYVIITNIEDDAFSDDEEDEISYEAYIKCGNKYKTSGYVE